MEPTPTKPTNTNTPLTPPQDNLARIPKASAYWMSQYFWSESARFGAPYYHGLFALKGADAGAAARAFANRA
jgi:hypothetical protein